MRYQLSNGNIVVADQAFIDKYHAGAQLLPNTDVKMWNAYDFAYTKFTQAERVAATSLAKTDLTASDFLHMLDNAIANGKLVVANDKNVISGLDYLSANPAVTPVLAAGRKQEILS